MNLVNLTPHTINIFDGEGNEIKTVPASGEVARVNELRTAKQPVGNIPVTTASYGNVIGLPAPSDDTIYIVSSLVLQRTSRADVFAPGPAVRDESGRIVGCNGLSASNTVGDSVPIMYGCEQDQEAVEEAINWLGGMVVDTGSGWPTYGTVVRKHAQPLVDFARYLIDEISAAGGWNVEEYEHELNKIIANSTETYTAAQVAEWITRFADDSYDAGTWNGVAAWGEIKTDKSSDSQSIADAYKLPVAVVKLAREKYGNK